METVRETQPILLDENGDEVMPWDENYAELLLKLRAKESLKQDEKHQVEAEGQSDPLAFPDIMSGAASRFTDIYSSKLESPREFFYLGYLTFLGLILSGKVSINTQIRPQPRIFPIFLGKTASTRKSTAIEVCLKFFAEVAPHSFNDCLGAGSAEGLQHVANDMRDELKRIALIYDEFKVFVGKSGIRNSALLPCVCTLFENNSYENATKHSEIRLKDIHLVMIGATTTETYQQIWNPAFTDIGLNNRLFLIPGKGKKKYALPSKIEDSEARGLRQEFHELILHAQAHEVLDLTNDARELFDEWYRELPSSIHCDRLDTYGLRFLILLAINDKKDKIDLETVERVVSLMDWQLRIRQEYAPVRAQNRVARMSKNIMSKLALRGERDLDTGRSWLRERDLKRAVHAYDYGQVYTQAIKLLKDSGDIRIIPSGKSTMVELLLDENEVSHYLSQN